jgi:hypothetical protein
MTIIEWVVVFSLLSFLTIWNILITIRVVMHRFKIEELEKIWTARFEIKE